MSKKRILVVGNWEIDHVRRFLSFLCRDKDEFIIDALDLSRSDIFESDCNVSNVYRLKFTGWGKVLYKIPKIRGLFYSFKLKKLLESLLNKNNYDLVNLHQIPSNAYMYIELSHRYNTKTMLTPFGSDVLRVKDKDLKKLQIAFDKTDFVSGNTLVGFTQKVCTLFNVPDNKVINLGYGSETISSIIELKDKYNRKQLTELLDIPYSDYYITCGYNASPAQQHQAIIRAIADNRTSLPTGYCLIIPLSYGAKKEEMHNELLSLCTQLGLKVVLLKEYLTVEQVAALRLISDLFIHVQTTDAYNASLQEFLIADTECINGKWLDYPSLERYGNPYHVCENLEELPLILGRVLRKELMKPIVHPEVFKEIYSNSWSNKILYWHNFYKQL